MANKLAEQFVHKYSDKAVWQVDVFVYKLARMIELEMTIGQHQGGTTQQSLQAEYDKLNAELFAPDMPTKDEFWNEFNGAWGTAQTTFGQHPEMVKIWIRMRNYIKKLENEPRPGTSNSGANR